MRADHQIVADHRITAPPLLKADRNNKIIIKDLKAIVGMADRDNKHKEEVRGLPIILAGLHRAHLEVGDHPVAQYRVVQAALQAVKDNTINQ